MDEIQKEAVAYLPFKLDPKEKLTTNRTNAIRRMDNVCRKYDKEREIKPTILAGFKKLKMNGHFKLLADLPKEQQKELREADPSYYIPYDIAFKEGMDNGA